MKKTVSVSIISANYNNGRYLKDFIVSIDESTVLPKELIIIDDGSLDDSMEILSGFSHIDYLIVIAFEKNRGFCVALNAGIEYATGDYIMRIDPDDMVLQNRIEIQTDYLDKSQNIDVVGSNVIYVNHETKEEIFRSNFPTDNSAIRSKYKKGEHGVQHPSTMIRAGVMKKYPYNQENFKAEDYEIFARMIADDHNFANITEPLTKMRVHGHSVSSNIKHSTIKLTYKIRDEIFKTSTNKLRVRFYFWHILNYKKFLITGNKLMKPIYLAFAIACYPSKFFSRIF